MDINEIITMLAYVPAWVWVIGAIIFYVMIFGDRKLWELEVKFPNQHGVGRGEIEFECLKKKGTSIEVEFNLEDLFKQKTIEIYLNNRLVYTVHAVKNNGARIFIKEKIDIQKPNEGDKVLVNIDGQKQFEGVLVRD
ncbi:MAG: hypothetical protein AB8B92_08560 [Gammaproteobacteria bacterium]